MTEQVNSISKLPVVTQYALIKKSKVIYIVERYGTVLVEGNPDSSIDVIRVFKPLKSSVTEYKRTHNLELLVKDRKRITYKYTPRVATGTNRNDSRKTSQLSKLAKLVGVRKDLVEEKQTVVTEDEPPLYTTILVEGTDSFTGNYGLGFADMAPTTKSVINGEVVAQLGEQTGLFVALDSLSLIKTYVPAQEMKDSIRTSLDNYASLLITPLVN